MDPAAIACSTGGDGAIQDAIKKLNKIYISSKKTGKENACGKESVATAQQCLKAAQAQLPKPGSNVEHLATLCQSSIRVMEQDRSKEGLRRAQHAAYSTIRQLVSAKAFGAAMEEALRLHGQLQKQRAAESLVPEALNLAVGTLITLALCWAEGAPTSSDQLASILHAAETSEQLFR